MMRPDDNGVSELLGYTVLVAVVSVAAIGLLAGGMGTLSASERQMELSGSIGSMKAFASQASIEAGSNNTFFTAYEMSVPMGYELLGKDMHDDFRSLSIDAGQTLHAFFPMGSIRLQSPFRSVTYEGGAVISNDTGQVADQYGPGIHAIRLKNGGNALYISLITVSCDSFAKGSGPATLELRSASVRPMTWHVPYGTTTTLRVSSGDAAGWGKRLKECGFTVEYEDGSLKAASSDVSDIYVTVATIEVRRDAR